jgi:hypothetical protein
MQDGATALCAYSINVLTEVFEDRLISYKLWPARSPDLSYSYLWGNLKDNMYSNKPHTLDETITSPECQTIFSRDSKSFKSRRETF